MRAWIPIRHVGLAGLHTRGQSQAITGQCRTNEDHHSDDVASLEQ